MNKTKNGAPYETPTLEVAHIEREDVISTSGEGNEGVYDGNGWT